MFDVKDRVAIVTGGSRGIGAAIVKVFLNSGAKVAVCARNSEKGEAFVESLNLPEDRVKFFQVDVSSFESVKKCFEEIISHFGEVNILVNNAGITIDKLFLRMKEEDWDKVLNVNLKGAFYFSKLVVPHFIKKRWGRIINMTSVVGLTGNPGQANYCASKAGIIGFTKSLAKELASRNITVNAVAPGYIETDMTKDLPDKAKEEMLKNIPLRRVGRGEDVAYGVLFLSSHEAGYITGQVLNINGGMYM